MQIRRSLRRLFVIGALAGAVAAAVRAVQSRFRPDPAFAPGAASWPPLTPTAPADAAAGWVEPLPDGTCPASHPLKANVDSGIYHAPGGLSYQRTSADRCYALTSDAEADGLRAARR